MVSIYNYVAASGCATVYRTLPQGWERAPSVGFTMARGESSRGRTAPKGLPCELPTLRTLLLDPEIRPHPVPKLIDM